MKDWFLHGVFPEDSSKNFFEWSLDKELLVIAYGFLACIVFGYAAILLLFPDKVGTVTCLFRIIWGVYCPVCGGSRAALYMVTGHWLKSLNYNPVVLVGSLIAFPYVITNTLCYATKGKIKGMRYHTIYLVIMVVLMVLNCIWKNYELLHNGVALIP